MVQFENCTTTGGCGGYGLIFGKILTRIFRMKIVAM